MKLLPPVSLLLFVVDLGVAVELVHRDHVVFAITVDIAPADVSTLWKLSVFLTRSAFVQELSLL
jgi:hypothetical protein